MLDKATKLKRLTEAEAAYHEILIGGGVRTLVDQNGERIEYQAANLSKLAQYIHQLKIELGIIKSPSGPVRVFF